MNFLMQKSKIAIFLLSIINLQVFGMEHRDLESGQAYELHRESSRQSINAPQIKTKKKCRERITCQNVTQFLNIALIVVLIVAAYKLSGPVQDLIDKVNTVFPFINDLKKLLSKVEAGEGVLISLGETALQVGEEIIQDCKLIPPK
ncbi:MAG: hypothetical protein P4L22_04945 [Candidatus Babeliales bacterium]|nr:hypothetical protein [Candidatus Babeliales bacterium]